MWHMEIERAETFLPYFENIRARTIRVASLIPPDHVDWTHRSGAFTLGDLVRHIAATEQWMFAENVRGGPAAIPDMDGNSPTGATPFSPTSRGCTEDAMIIFRGLTAEQLARR